MGKKGVKVKQHDITDCGAACIASVCAYYGLQFPVSRIRQYAYTDQKGTNLLGLIEAANKLGFAAKGVRARFEALSVIPKPAIAHVVIDDKYEHFIVIYKVKKNSLVYMDPADGKMHTISFEEFEKMWSGKLVLMEPELSFRGGNKKKSLFGKFMSLLMPHKGLMFQALFGAVIFSILGLSTSVYIGKITDNVLINQNTNLLNLMGIIMIGILVLRTFIGSMKSILALKTGQRIDAALILGYYKHLLKLPQQFFDTMRVGEIISRVNDAVKIRELINNVSIDLIVNTLIIVFTFCFMCIYSWVLALIIVACIPIFLIIHRLFNMLNRKYLRKVMESGADLESQLVESINSISTIKRFGVEEYSNLKTENRFVHLLRNTYRSIYTYIMTQGGIQFITTGMIIAVLWTGSLLVIDKEITPGTLMVFYSLIMYLVGPIDSLISANQNIQEALIAADRLFQIMDLEREEEGSGKIKIEKDMIGDIVFDEVSFRYGSRKEVFQRLNLFIPKGRTTAIIGESGSGKTTVVSLLQNIYPIQSGSIRIGGFDISQISNESLRKIVGTVPQKIELFAGSIIENIALGDFNPDMKRINELAVQLGLKDFIEKLPKQYYTHVGEQGASLSGGERQRIAIARALYKEPEILIFDEATSSLDSISEKYVKATLKDLASKGKTIIIIAHRLSTVKEADSIIVLKNGEVAEAGTHDELYKSCGLYSQLWHEQYDHIILT